MTNACIRAKQRKTDPIYRSTTLMVTDMNIKLVMQRLSIMAVVAAAALCLPAHAQHHGGPAVHGGGFHGYRDGGVWWGLGLGLGLGWDAEYYGYPYSWYYYPPYNYAAPTTVIVPPNTPTAWYYCDSLRNYYPAVDHCPEQWRIVPATPPTSPPTSPPAAPQPTPPEQPKR